MLSAAHLSSRKCPDFGIHYKGNCSDKITLSKMSSTRHLRHACRLAQFHDRLEAEIKAFMWEKISREIDINISLEALCWVVESVCLSSLCCVPLNAPQLLLYIKQSFLLMEIDLKYLAMLCCRAQVLVKYGKEKNLFMK